MVIPVTLPCSFTDVLFEVSVVDVVCDVLPETGTWLIWLSFDVSLALEPSRVTSWIFILSEASFSGSSISMPTPSSVKEELDTVWSGGRESALSFKLEVEVAPLDCLLAETTLVLASPLLEFVDPRPVCLVMICGCEAVEADFVSLRRLDDLFLLDSDWVLGFCALLSPPAVESSCPVP